ncbi:MAG: DUF134 domain-containing protein [Salinivirgaceae bacterium]|jgi:predicted DNA-binding protein (UPF0251 family)/predicted Fe-Mo cluster-binding NifX family protein|nr:DUF134 domain-containing protein [Salinivirgaceae bacterium]
MAPRKKRCRHILNPPGYSVYRPEGVAHDEAGEAVIVLYEEYEALRLADYALLKHNDAAEKMNVSRSSFARIYESARRKMAKAFVEARPIAFEAGCAYFTKTEDATRRQSNNYKKSIQMKEIVAIPSDAGVLANHFGHAPEFAFIEIENEKVKAVDMKLPPEHEPGVIPRWVSENGATTVIAGGMGGKAIELFRQNNINVVTGAENLEVETLAQQFAEGKLTGGGNRCEH